jgi:predicted 3-demethylubiquinone-9 3-methyltransferase (glyoxalase superfamily)
MLPTGTPRRQTAGLPRTRAHGIVEATANLQLFREDPRMRSLGTCLWFDTQAEEAMGFYASVFPRAKLGRTARYNAAHASVSKRPVGSVLTVELDLEGLSVLALNGGPDFKPTPALSFFVWCDTRAEVDELWRKLGAGGTVRMELGEYPWAKAYGWTADRFGVEWQIILNDGRKHRQRIAPALLLVDRLYGKGEEALATYAKAFAPVEVVTKALDEETGAILHAEVVIAGQTVVLSEGRGQHGWAFNEAHSLVVACDSQAEIDRTWADLIEGGGSPGPCGWLKDKLGVSWQIVPRAMGDIMVDPRRAGPATQAMLKMQKLDLATLMHPSR